MSASRLKEKRNNRVHSRCRSPKWSRFAVVRMCQHYSNESLSRSVRSVFLFSRFLRPFALCVIIKRLSKKKLKTAQLSHEFQYCMASARAIILIEPNSISTFPHITYVPQRLLELIAFFLFFFISFPSAGDEKNKNCG